MIAARHIVIVLLGLGVVIANAKCPMEYVQDTLQDLLLNTSLTMILPLKHRVCTIKMDFN